MSEKIKKKESVHSHHRERMRRRIIGKGFDELEDHEFLECLLYSAQPRCDTNVFAHNLLEHFGTLKHIFSATPEELMQVKGIGEQTAIFLVSYGAALRRVMAELTKQNGKFDSLSKIVHFLHGQFLGLGHERLYMLLFDNRMHMLDCITVSEGTVCSAEVPTRLMVETLFRRRAAAVILAHNHPDGMPIPSPDDIHITEELDKMLEMLQIELVEHLVFADNKFCTIIKEHCKIYRISSVSAAFNHEFYENFYDMGNPPYEVQPLEF